MYKSSSLPNEMVPPPLYVRHGYMDYEIMCLFISYTISSLKICCKYMHGAQFALDVGMRVNIYFCNLFKTLVVKHSNLSNRKMTLINKFMDLSRKMTLINKFMDLSSV